MILSALGTVLRWLLAGMFGRILLSAFTQGIVVAGTLFWGGSMAEWAFGKMIDFIRSSGFWDSLTDAFSQFGNLPNEALQLWGCLGAKEAFVSLIAGQISCVGVALICRKLL